MKHIITSVLLCVCAAVAKAEPEISGIFTSGEVTRFVLVESKTGESSGWVKIGDEFSGYRLVSFDRVSEALTLDRGGTTVVAGLKNAVIKDMRIALSGSIRLGVDDEIAAQKVVLICGEESSFPWDERTRCYVKPTRRADGNVEYTARWEKVTSNGSKVIIRAPKVITRPGGVFSLDMGDFGFALKP